MVAAAGTEVDGMEVGGAAVDGAAAGGPAFVGAGFGLGLASAGWGIGGWGPDWRDPCIRHRQVWTRWGWRIVPVMFAGESWSALGISPASGRLQSPRRLSAGYDCYRAWSELKLRNRRLLVRGLTSHLGSEFCPQPGRPERRWRRYFSKKAAQRSDWPSRPCWCCSASSSQPRQPATVRRFASWLRTMAPR
jgi:hypothetical protein